MEGIAIDKGLTMAHLKGTLEHLARAIAEHPHDPDETPAQAYYTALTVALERLVAVKLRVGEVEDLRAEPLHRVGQRDTGEAAFR